MSVKATAPANERLILALLLLVPIAVASSTTIFNDGDVSWHIAAGRWIADHHAVPSVDPFSFTFAGKPWVAFEWLSQLIYAGAYRLGAYGGLAAAVMLALIVLHLCVIAEMRRWLSPALVVFGVMAMNAVLVPFTLARPHLLAWPVMALWLTILIRARDRDRAPPLASALLMTLWANLHGSWVIGLVMAGAFALEAMMEARWERGSLLRWLAFGVASVAAAAINANGLAGLIHPFTVSNFAMLPLIKEWQPSSIAVTPLFFVVLGIVAALILWRGVRLSLARMLLLACLLGMALYQVRHQSLLVIAAAMILPAGFARQSGSAERPAIFSGTAERRRWWLAAGAMIVLLAGARTMLPLRPMENAANPWGLLAVVPDDLRQRPVLNGWNFGGPLILSGIRPYIDGRADIYGDPFVIEFKRISDGDPVAVERALKRWDIAWTLSEHRQRSLIALMDSKSDWQRLHADKVGVIHVRRDVAAQLSASGNLRANP
jgi:hypothetical protein